jgi:glycosyltransferase involved in cell wall biosynthesis
MPGKSERPFFLDATAILRWGPNVPTGIPRVEANLVSEALAALGPRAALFAFDPGLRRCRALTADERTFVEKCVAAGAESGLDPGPRPGFAARLREVVALYRFDLFCAGRETHRSIAQYLIGSEGRGGATYLVAKTCVRAAFIAARLWARVTRRDHRAGAPDPLAVRENTCLLSMNTCSALYRHYAEETCRCRLLVLVYDTTPLDYPDFAAEGHAERFASYFRFGVTVASDILCISAATCESVRKWCAKLGIETSKKRFHVVPLASSLSDERVQAAPIPELADVPYVLYCATLEPRKNHLVLLRAWSRLVEKRGRTAMPMLVLVGRWGWRIEATRQILAGDPNLAGTVKIFSFLPDRQLKWLYERALFTVFPSVAEGWGLGATESLDLGTPVLISDIAALQEASQRLMPALLPDDEPGWRDGIDRLISEPELRQSLRKAIAEKYLRRSFRDVFAGVLRIGMMDF